jgi:hypothetical protein
VALFILLSFFTLALNYLFGIIDRIGFIVILAAVASVVPISLWKKGSSHFINNLLLFFLSVSFMLPVSDLILRYTVVDDFTIYPLPEFPQVRRQLPNRTLVERGGFGVLAHALGDLKRFTPYPYYKLETDEWGFTNGRQFDPDATFDLVVLGDSYSVVDYDSEDEEECSYGALLNKDPNYSTLNLAMVATGPWEQAVNLFLVLPEIKTAPGGRILWGIFTGNDLEEFTPLSVRPASLPTRLLTAVGNFRRQSGLRIALRPWFTDEDGMSRPRLVRTEQMPNGEPLYFFKPYIRNSRRSRAEIENHRNFPALTQAFAVVNSWAADRQLELILLIFPSKAEVYTWVLRGLEPWEYPEPVTGIAEAIGRWCASHSIRCHDLTPYLREEAREIFEESGELVYYPDDTHWSTRGNRATYEYIRNHVLD